jgi:DNA-binding protein HU-beta
MNREELISQMAQDAKTTKVAAKAALDSFITSVSKTLKKGGRISLVGFGTFSTSKRNARSGRNPKTGETIQIKAKRVARFKPGKELSVTVNNVK